MDNLYTKSRNKMHTFSRSPLAEGQLNYDQANARSGHTIYFNEIRSNEIPVIETFEDREKFLIKDDNDHLIVGGEKGYQYNKVLKFIECAKLEKLANSNGESYNVIDEERNPIKNWIDPSDKPIIKEGLITLSNGYEISLIINGKKISRNYGWEFDSFSGIVHFSSEFKPGTEKWIETFGTNEPPCIQGFIYIGNFIDKNLNNLQKQINDNVLSINDVNDSSIAIQPIKFNTDIMIKMGDPTPVEFSSIYKENCDYIQTLYFDVPGYCFDVSLLFNNQAQENIKVNMYYAEPNTVIDNDDPCQIRPGFTRITIDLLWDIIASRPIVGYGKDNENMCGKFNFIAKTLVQKNGNFIISRDVIDYTLCGHN